MRAPLPHWSNLEHVIYVETPSARTVTTIIRRALEIKDLKSPLVLIRAAGVVYLTGASELHVSG